ncbi:hypothetical protein BDA99DRAFT_525731 [Phascolomyces articulosus]|uniref:Nitrogen regulatory protein areA GATA-like domain-containing protein n=1 Tax=Phascolomyces articulosus TaxID=60185 RepID=A0AAD5P8U6_9FUNG|nr:hypothetical protein BDA99DRAFT_525731 [Phascolomyces articulosus]
MLTMDMQLVTYIHSTQLPWNNLDELSSLWAVFTKCKRQLRNGFRLENMTWRLWYRQAVMQKLTAPPSSILSPTSSTTSNDKEMPLRSLSRSRSLPDLRIPSRLQQQSSLKHKVQQISTPSTPTTTTVNNKFFIDDDESDCEDDMSSMEYDDEEEDDWYHANHSATTTVYSSTVTSVTSFHDQEELFCKQELNSCSTTTTTIVPTSPKPISLLSTMLLQEQKQVAVAPTPATNTTSMLRRCKGFSHQLDTWFSKAAV